MNESFATKICRGMCENILSMLASCMSKLLVVLVNHRLCDKFICPKKRDEEAVEGLDYVKFVHLIPFEKKKKKINKDEVLKRSRESGSSAF